MVSERKNDDQIAFICSATRPVVRGVHFNRRSSVWVAVWTDQGQRHSKSFSVQQYGDHGAFLEAKSEIKFSLLLFNLLSEAREAAIKEIEAVAKNADSSASTAARERK